MGFLSDLVGSVTGDGALGFASGLMSMFGQNSNIDSQIKAQAAENQRDRDFQQQMANQQNQWNIDQWNRENEYNDPSSVRQRFINAGFNPNLIAGSISGQSASSAVGTAVSAQGNRQDMSPLGQKMTLGQAIQSGLETAAAQAQIDNINADTQKKKNEAQGQGYQNEILKSDAAFRDALNAGAVGLQDVDITIKSKEANWFDSIRGSELNKMRAETRVLNNTSNQLVQSIRESRARIANLNADTAYKEIVNQFQGKLMQSEITKNLASANLSYTEARMIAEQIPYVAADMIAGIGSKRSQIRLNGATINNLGIQGDRLQFDLDFDKDTRETAFVVQQVNSVIGSIKDALSAGLNFKFLGRMK